MQGPVAKKDVALFLLESSLVQFHLDPRKSGVALPDYLRQQPQVALDIGLNTAVPIPDLDVGENGIRCTLSFNRTPFPCVLPWSAIFAMVTRDGKAAVWPEDVPPESPLSKELAEPQKPRLSAVPALPPEAPISIEKKRAKNAKTAGTNGEPTAKKGRSPKGSAAPKTDAKAALAVSPSPKGEAKPAKKRPKKDEFPKAKEPAAVTTRPAVVPLARPLPAPAPAPAEPEPPIDEGAQPETNKSAHASKKKRELPPYLRVVK